MDGSWNNNWDGTCLLWVDLKHKTDDPDLPGDLRQRCVVYRITQPHELDDAVLLHRPHFLCFDFDIPDYAGLSLLQQTKARYSALPIIMFTGQHSEALAVWALRARVWDYFIRPVVVDDVIRSLSCLLRIRNQTSATRANLAPVRPPPLSAAGVSQRTCRALRYIQERFSEPITLEQAANLCHVSPSTFSRLFHREHGRTFREFVLDYRIAKAKELLISSNDSVSTIAFSVGFNDLSYFSRAFRRFTGVCPTEFRPSSVV